METNKELQNMKRVFILVEQYGYECYLSVYSTREKALKAMEELWRPLLDEYEFDDYEDADEEDFKCLNEEQIRFWIEDQNPR